MLDYRLSDPELSELRAAHRRAPSAREAYRINALVLLGQGWSAAAVADALLIDADTVRNYFKRYKHGGLDALLRMNFVGPEALLAPEQIAELKTHLRERLHPSAGSVARWVQERWQVPYSLSGMTVLLRRIGFVFKKARLVPGKADTQAQEAFVADYKKRKEISADDEVTLFMDATHPQHNPVIGCGWIPRGEEHPIKSNTGRRRLNINAAIDVGTMAAQVRFDDTIDATSTIALMQQIEHAYPRAAKITIICDNARYYRSKAVRQYLETSRVELLFLPPYSPNLNLIERFWKFFKRKVLYNHYYEAFDDFRSACKNFFRSIDVYASQLRSLLVENFEIIRY